MAEEALEGGNMSREESEARLGVAKEVLERAAEEAKWREEALKRVEEGEQLEVQRLTAE